MMTTTVKQEGTEFVRAGDDAGDRPWYRQPHLLRLNLAILSVLQLSSTNGYDGSLLNSLQALPSWQTFMSHPTGVWLGFIVAVQSIGQIVLYPVVAYVIQRYGRKAGVWSGYLFLLLGTGFQAGSKTASMFIVSRLFIGMATACWFGSVPVLIGEVAHPKHRATCTAFWNCGWFVGGLVAAWVVYGTKDYTSSWSWRLPALLQLVLPCTALPGLLYVPESPRWLVAQGNVDAARTTLLRHHIGDIDQKHDGLADSELEEIEGALRAEQETSRSMSYASMFQSKANLHRSFITITLGFFAQWNGVGIIQYYLVLILETVGITGVRDQTLIGGCLQIWNLFFAVAGSALVERAGRRGLFGASNVGMLMAFVVVTALSATFAQTGEGGAGIGFVVMLFVYYGFYCLAWTPLIFAYPVEIWPYGLRAKGLTLCMTSTALALMFNIFVNPIALQNIGWRYYIVYVVVLLIQAVVCWLYYPETKGRSLEQTAALFDDNETRIRHHGSRFR